MTKCINPGCFRDAVVHGLCSSHYYKLYNYTRPWIGPTNNVRDKHPEAIVPLNEEEQALLEITYLEAQRLRDTTGVSYVVDHIIPLREGGKHHPDNLQIITSKLNANKDDYRYWDIECDMPDGLDILDNPLNMYDVQLNHR